MHQPFDPRIFRRELGTLRDAGYDAHLVAKHTHDETVDGIHISALPRRTGKLGRLALQRLAYQHARDLNAAIYHLHDPELLPLGWALKRSTGARVIYDMHEHYRLRPGWAGQAIGHLENWAFRWLDAVVLVSPHDEPLPWMQPFDVKQVNVLNYFLPPAGTDTLAVPPIPKRLPEAGQPFRVLYAGIQARLRGADTMLDLAGLSRDAGLEWRIDLPGICNLPHDRTHVAARIEREHLSNVERTDWRTFTPWADLIPWFERAHAGTAFLAPTPGYLESIPTKFYEYLHFGLPILASDFPAWRRFIEQHECGAVVPPGDAHAAFDILKRWASDPVLYSDLSAASLKASSLYQWDHMGRRLVGLYKDEG